MVGARIGSVAQEEGEFKPASTFVDALSAGGGRGSEHFAKSWSTCATSWKAVNTCFGLGGDDLVGIETARHDSLVEAEGPMLLMLWLLGYLIGQEEAAPAVPPPPPLAVRVQADPLPLQVYRFLKEMREGVHRTPREQQVVDPLDGRGRVEDFEKPANPRLLAILEKWAAFNQPAARQRVRFQRYRYSTVFEREFRAKGEIRWEQDAIRFDLLPPDRLPESGINPARQARNGKPFQVLADDAFSYVQDGTSSLLIDQSKRTFLREESVFPWLASTAFAPLSPFREFSVDARFRKFDIEEVPRGASGQIHLKFVGRWQAWAAHHSQVDVLLDPATGRPLAMRLIDPGKTTETVYVYEPVERGGPEQLWDQNPFQPNLNGYIDMDQRRAR